MKVWVVVEPYDDGGAAGDFLVDIFENEQDADKLLEKVRYGAYEKKLWEVK